MTRIRRLPLASRVCIGVFLLVFSAVAADTIKGPPELEGLPPIEAGTRNEKEPGPRVPSTDQTALGSAADNERPVNSTKQEEEKEPYRTGLAVTKAPGTEEKEEEEKVRTEPGKDIEVQGIRSHEAGGLSTPDPNNGRSRFEEENHYSQPGKSTKALSEDIYSQSRTNGLAAATAKPGLEDPRLGQRRNWTSADPSIRPETGNGGREVVAGSTVENGTRTKDDEESGGIRSGNRLEKGKLISASAEVRDVEGQEDGGEKEPTTPRGFQEGTRPDEYFGKNSEAFDLEKVRETKEEGESISLINDTNVNYSHYYKTLTEKDLETGPGNRSSVAASENGTNFISAEDVAVSHVPRDPKEEVEVVRNVTQPPTERIIEKQSTVDNSTVPTKEAKFDSGRSSKIGGQNSSNGHTTKSAGFWPDSNSTDTEEDRSKFEVARTTDEQGPGNSSLIPRGRTIAFSGVNEFPSQETKTTTKEIDTPPAKKNTSLEKTIEQQKPYPYTKSTRPPLEPVTSGLQSPETTTEGGSAYENAIDRGDSEKKVVVTEPSVVIENSIQQYKPSEKSANESLNFTTESQTQASTMTTGSMATVEVLPTNQTFLEKPHTDPVGVGVREKDEVGSAPGNDVPGGKEGSKVITGKDENFDVTGNGITEVSLKPESSDNANNRPPYEGSYQTGASNGTTEVPSTTSPAIGAKMATNVDVQTDAEESLLIRSTLNVSEASTEYPLTKGTERSKLDKPIVSASTEPTSILNSTIAQNTTTIRQTSVASQPSPTAIVSTTSEEVNGTNEIAPSGMSATTLNPDESSPPSTTSIEYEFVGLSEGTASQNTTETMPEEPTSVRAVTVPTTTVPTVQGLATQDYSDYPSSTLNSESTMDDGPASTTEILPNVENFTIAGPDRWSTLETRNTTTGLRIDTSESPLNETETEGGRTVVSNETVTDSGNGTETEVATTISTMEEHTMGTTTPRDPQFIPVTEISTRDSQSISTTTSVSSSLPPRIFVSGTWKTPTTASGDSVTGGTVDVVQNLSPDEITSLVRIVMKGTCEDVYPHLEKVRTTLAEMLEEGTNVSVHASQIIFHQNPCQDASSPSPTPTDVPLTSILVYVVDQDGKFDSAMTNMLPSLYKESRAHFPVAIHSFLLVQETDSGNAIAVVVVSSVAFICLILLAGLLFIMRKRQTRFNYGERCRPVSLDAYSLDSVSAYNSVRRKGVARSSKRSYGNPTFEDSSAIPSHPLNFAGLSSFCNDVNAINEEFSSIPQVSAKIDELPSGAELKNRYANVIPLPETRVPLQRINNDPLTEYINANYVRGPRNATRYYIACQAPMDATVTDFWRMVWEQQCKVIIMLTDLVENGVEKCTEYIPPSEVTDCHRLYGDFQVTLKKRETKEKYAISTLHLKNLENNTFREVFHIWYLWPVNAVQSDGTGLIAVILEARALQRGGPGSIVVHCSPGTGRTGTLIALDLGIRQYEITRTVDVPRVVYTIRRDRAGAVQTKEQYAFIYKALNLYATKLAGGVLEST